MIDWKHAYEEKAKSHDDLLKAYNQLKDALASIENAKEAPIRKAPVSRERNTLLKLIIGLAIGGYGYDPKSSKSTVPKQISDDFVLFGLDITDDTVRKWLKEASGILPADFQYHKK